MSYPHKLHLSLTEFQQQIAPTNSEDHGMNYYERHLGDYTKATAHLSMIEHGAYGLLLDRYYITEAPIPADQAHRIARARSKDEKAAVDAVLSEFFKLDGGLWRHDRCDSEIENSLARIAAARNNGKRGGRPKRIADQQAQEPSGLLLGSDLVTQVKALQTPDTNTNTKTPQPPEKSGGDDPPGFADFWTVWPASPRKQDRKKCAAKWRRGGYVQHLAVILAHVETSKQSKQWRDGYEPAPLTYLNGERWADGEAVESPADAGYV